MTTMTPTQAMTTAMLTAGLPDLPLIQARDDVAQAATAQMSAAIAGSFDDWLAAAHRTDDVTARLQDIPAPSDTQPVDITTAIQAGIDALSDIGYASIRDQVADIVTAAVTTLLPQVIEATRTATLADAQRRVQDLSGLTLDQMQAANQAIAGVTL